MSEWLIQVSKNYTKYNKQKTFELEPPADYIFKPTNENCITYLDGISIRNIRYTWIPVRRKRPKAPSFAGAPLPRHR